MQQPASWKLVRMRPVRLLPPGAPPVSSVTAHANIYLYSIKQLLRCVGAMWWIPRTVRLTYSYLPSSPPEILPLLQCHLT